MAMSPTVWHPAVARRAATKYRFCFYSATSVVARTSASRGLLLHSCFWSMSTRSQYKSSIVMLAVVIDIGLMVISCVFPVFLPS